MAALISEKPRISAAVRFRVIRATLYWIGLGPAVWTFFLGLTDQLGANPMRTLEQTLGLWALRFLIATLAVTPFRDLTGISLLRYRRALGLLAFYYALLHFTTYIVLDQGLNLSAIAADIVKRPYITIGMLAFAVLVPLAATSNDTMVRRMGRAWSRLHRWVYLAAAAAAVHFLLVVKSWTMEPVVYFAIVAILLGYRLYKRLRGSRGNRRRKPVPTR
ncbi:protein-methionine-sulfoxide reductase heme-binding subunit MsrQ [Chelativorans intermedius]|uniref:Protein-methionine-sulfoxide reductase heme-binding subunit MsrQ n=1 Tax=Chelativorans intermedius TaxID=515947 RepID=A0ABV6D816_9HYPH|nr:protein-methionine-sulfoxide reductase heme-binding subunit MsrQ [Chelativorans intermedius]MCT8999866.1 protein-methionine-sulfoxide reductase heme-binding subunit MsrQ [Chelativorans intermedius]